MVFPLTSRITWGSGVPMDNWVKGATVRTPSPFSPVGSAGLPELAPRVEAFEDNLLPSDYLCR